MFEYSFRGLEGDLSVHGTTTDFLQVLCEITHSFSFKVAGEFVEALLEDQCEEIDCLRMIDWKFSYTYDGKSIHVHNVIH